MGLFSKKSSDAEALEDKEIKDLKPENKKLRKEPPKPWGKFERIVVLIVLLFTVFTAIGLMLYSRGVRLPKINLDVSKFNIFEKETIIIE